MKAGHGGHFQPEFKVKKMAASNFISNKEIEARKKEKKQRLREERERIVNVSL